MKKKYDALKRKLDALDATKSDEVASVQSDIRNTREKILQLKEVIGNTDNLEDYDRNLKDISYNEGKLKVLNNRMTTLSKFMSDAEFTEIQRELMKDVSDLKKDYGERIYKKLEDLLSIMDEYNEDTREISKLYILASNLNGRKTGGYSSPIDAKDIRVKEDRLKWFEGFIKFYYGHKTQLNNFRHLGLIK